MPQLEYTVIMLGIASVLFILWLWFFRKQDKLKLITRSIWLFAIPISVLLLDNYWIGLLSAVPYLLFIAVEEIIKLLGSKISTSSREAFALITLMGIWEICLTKAILPFVAGDQFNIFLQRNLVQYALVSTVPFVMHVLTAAIYAPLKYKPWLIPLALCIIVHLVFNATRDFYFVGNPGSEAIDVSFFVTDAAFFGMAWFVLWLFMRKQFRGHNT